MNREVPDEIYDLLKPNWGSIKETTPRASRNQAFSEAGPQHPVAPEYGLSPHGTLRPPTSPSPEDSHAQAAALGHPNLEARDSASGFVHRTELEALAGNQHRYNPANVWGKEIHEDGIREHLHVGYDPVSGYARLDEGNHRLAASMQDYLPVKVHRTRGLGPKNATKVSEQPGFPREQVPGVAPEHQYVPGQFHPRYIFRSAK